MEMRSILFRSRRDVIFLSHQIGAFLRRNVWRCADPSHFTVL